MGMYMYKMSIPEYKKFVNTDKSYDIDDVCITLEILRQCNVGEDDDFTIDSDDMTLDVTHRRLETDDEFNARVQTAINYNKRYDEYHANNLKE
jgi:hypothetical protein